MAKLREGDTVIFKAVVTRVADYGDEQQIEAKILPKGEHLGWCLPKENAFYPDKMKIIVGDEARIAGRSRDKIYKVEALFADKQVAVKERGCWPVEIVIIDKLERI